MKSAFLFLILTLFAFTNVFSQGCSDAGACSVGFLNFTNEKNDFKPLKLDAEQSFGLGEKFVFISQTTAIVSYNLKQKLKFELRTPFIFTSGNLGNSSGPGDLIISSNIILHSDNKSILSLILAGRLNTNNADKSYNSVPLPMAYQTSLGTNDIIIGAFNKINYWDFYLAWQHSFGNNQNNYLHPESESDKNKLYYESNKLKRGDDAYFRLRRAIGLRNNKLLTLTAMAIYRLQKDEILKNGNYLPLDGSEGLTLNLAFNYLLRLKNNRKIDMSIAFPVIDKSYRSDGLTRNIVLAVKVINL